MNIRCLITVATLLAAVSAQKPAAEAQWRQLLEKAIFARSYEGSPDAAEKLFERALLAARATSDKGAEQEVLRQRDRDAGRQDPRTEKVIGRLLHSISTVDPSQRPEKIGSVDWEEYMLDDSAPQLVGRCLDGQAWIGGYAITLRAEDVLAIANEIDNPLRTPILARALDGDDPFVRSLTIEYCHKRIHRDLLMRAAVDPSQVVREAACNELNDEDRDEALDDLFLRALDMRTVAAIDRTFGLPGFVSRMRAASHDSWLAKSIDEVGGYLEVETWQESHLTRLGIVLDWAEAAPGPQSIRWLKMAGDWLDDARDADGYPAELAKRTMRVALARSAHFVVDEPSGAGGALGELVNGLGGIDELVALAPRWVVDRDRSRNDCSRLFDLCEDVDPRHVDRMIDLGVELAGLIPPGRDSDRIRHRVEDYWNDLGKHRWARGKAAALERALSSVQGLTEDVSGRIFGRFVFGIADSDGIDALFAVMEPHYARAIVDGLVNGNRLYLTSILMRHESRFTPAAAMEQVRRDWIGAGLERSGETEGDFLRKACAIAPDEALEAVLAAIRKGYTQQPKLSAGQQLAKTSWPALYRPMGGTGRNGRVPAIPTPPPADQIVLKQEKRTVTLPSLLCALPMDQAAEGAETLWNEANSPLPREQLVETLLFARSSKKALAVLARVFDAIDDVAMQASVLDVFGEMLYVSSRPLIARSLRSDEPMLRHAALQAANQLLSFERARAAFTVETGR